VVVGNLVCVSSSNYTSGTSGRDSFNVGQRLLTGVSMEEILKLLALVLEDINPVLQCFKESDFAKPTLLGMFAVRFSVEIKN